MTYSIIIPAHNEAQVIDRGLRSILHGAAKDEIEIIVVCNGCTDNTAEIVKGFGPPVRVLETQVASKSLALDLGDHAAQEFPRFYVDADVELSIEAIRKTGTALEESQFLAAAPVMEMDTTGSSWPVRAFYQVWMQLPYCRAGMIGSGVYALSKEARARFDVFPDLVSDDGYIRALFLEEERGAVSDCTVRVKAPAQLKGLVKIKTRSRLGWYELNERFPELPENEQKNYLAALLVPLRQPRLWPAAIIYLGVNLYTRLRARRQYRKGLMNWERDDSSRQLKDL